MVRNPIHATGVGLLLYARDNQLASNRARSVTTSAKTALDRMKSWFQGNF